MKRLLFRVEVTLVAIVIAAGLATTLWYVAKLLLGVFLVSVDDR